MAPHRTRPAFTLVELLVVLTILSVLATLVVVFVLPAFQDNRNVVRGVDRASGALLIAKQRALRDQLPRGVRLLPDAAGSTTARQLQYVEQPDFFSAGSVAATNNSTAVTFNLPPGVDFLNGAPAGQVDQYSVQPGDHLEVFGGGLVRRITSVANKHKLVLSQPLTCDATAQYRILRQPRPTVGEALVDLPNNVVIDLALSRNLSTRQVPGGQPVYDILFSPSGGVLGQGTSGSNLVLWVRDVTVEVPEPNTTRLIAVQFRTGFIAAHPMAPGADPYQFTKDGRSSGM
jgi:prepilin-type N-terminal cleavage/methylation domain-containing protein